MNTRFYHILIHVMVSAVALCSGSAAATAQWVKATLPQPFAQGYYLDVFFLESDTRYGWACSIEGYVVRTTDGGISWQGTATSRSFLEYIQFLTPLVGYTSGPAGIYKSTDGGATWQDITPPNPNQEQGWGSYFLTEQEGVFLLGGCGTSIQTFYRTTDGGRTFSATYQTEPNSGLSDALLYRDGSGFALSSGVIWRTTDYGVTWRKYSTTGSKVWHEELAIYGTTFLIPYSGTDCSGTGRGVGGVRISHDNGITWTQFDTRSNMFGTFLIDNNRGWAVGDGRSAYYTDDGGKTWTNRNCGIDGDLDDVFFIGDTLGWIAGNGLYKYQPRNMIPEVTIYPPEPLIELCEGDSVLLVGSIGYTSYTWDDGVQAQGRYAKKDGRYTLTAYDSVTCKESKAVVTLRYYPAPTARIADGVREVCDGDSARLELISVGVSHVWSTGDTTNVIHVKQSGSYSVTITDQYGCSRILGPITILVRPLPQPTITANRRTTICIGESITLSANDGYAEYQWSNGETTQHITTAEAGDYQVTVTDAWGCKNTSDVTTITVLDAANKIQIQSTLSDGWFTLPESIVGDIQCRELAIFNRSATEPLIIPDPTFVGNVLFSIPQAQLPLRIEPLQVGYLNICVSAIDTGHVSDTLLLPDTCSATLIPVSGYGKGIEYNGTSRCSVAVKILVTRAGVAHHLSSPYPLPANDRFTLEIVPPIQDVTAVVFDGLGTERAWPEVVQTPYSSVLRFSTASLPSGSYYVAVSAAGASPALQPIMVVH